VMLVYCCSFPPRIVLPASLLFFGLAAAGISIYMIAIFGPLLNNGTCDGTGNQDNCEAGLAKGVAVACIRAFVRYVSSTSWIGPLLIDVVVLLCVQLLWSHIL